MRCVQHVFFVNDTATTEIYTLSLHDALPIYKAATARCPRALRHRASGDGVRVAVDAARRGRPRTRPRRTHVQAVDRKSTRLNSSHANISYAVFCLKKNT